MDYEIVAGVPPQRVLIVGAGKSGLAAARFCAARGARVTVSDKRGPQALGDALEDPALRAVEWELGGHREETFVGADLIVLSPGVPELPELQAARARAVPVTGEIELGARFVQAPIVAVTGTNGKSTVTALAGEIARHTGRPTFVGGNLGTPLLSAIGDGGLNDATSARGIVVLELSSFQLETVEQLHPKAAALLNLTPDHLDRYADLAAYGAAKLRIAQRMGAGDALIVNADDAFFAEAARRNPAWRVLWFSLSRPLAAGEEGGFVDGRDLVLRLASHGGREERYPIAEMNLVGRHNQGNALASLLLMRGSDLASYEQARAGLGSFQPLPHRMQLVGERRGVRYYDDSKATNVDSVVAGVDGFPVPFVLIAGGRDKGGSYAPLVQALRHAPCRAVILIGEAAERIEAAIGEVLPTERAATLEEAVARGGALMAGSGGGGAVVLSPACSSYDMFQNYEHRGRVFRAAVEALP